MYEPPRGLTLVNKEGHVKYLCSAKCRKNMAMKRRRVNWIKKGKKTKNGKQEVSQSHSKAMREELKQEVAESK